MSRNDQVTRQWFILQALERPGGVTIEEIARTLPKDYACHLRTIRRDLQALEVRFPIYTDRADGQSAGNWWKASIACLQSISRPRN